MSTMMRVTLLHVAQFPIYSGGGKAGLRWAGSKLRELDLLSEMLDDDNPCQAGYEMVGMKMKKMEGEFRIVCL